ncbi:threonylcarbamoyl-AMP synthase [Pilimelia terevasa]|uniref:L-threonylcarbamoyladenylate synthase n=1 Tax=Pilimelia terevasa TaxID=53372 RepID=A0A8J3BPN9_9ACTN|nr:L-threonylcarbamoyladenylate synthase [Pilimelia terevasa]GGK18897.1 threonylcarbamoyl-AMP synthase [Pilimelia terevasa]
MTFYDCRTAAERDRAIAAAVEAVRTGELVVLPTDTVYGVGVDAFSADAVTRLLAAKGRDRQMPPPVLVGTRQTLDGLVYSLPVAARDLVDAFWPGALTLVVTHAPSLKWDLGETDQTVAVRMPMHPVALELLQRTGPMAVSSANRTGAPAANTAEEAHEQLGARVRVYLEAGPAAAEPALASTIVDCTGDVPRVLRAGAVPLAELREVVPELADVGEQ